MIEYFRLNIEYLRNSFHFKKDGAKRHPQIFNLQSSIFNPDLSGFGWCKPEPVTRFRAKRNKNSN